MTSEIVVMCSVYIIYFAIHLDTKTLKTCTYFLNLDNYTKTCHNVTRIDLMMTLATVFV